MHCFACMEAKRVWKHAGFWRDIKAVMHEEVKEIVLGMFWCVPREDFETLSILAWEIWWKRNRVVHGSSSCDTQTLVKFAEAFFKEIQSTIIIDDIPGPKES